MNIELQIEELFETLEGDVTEEEFAQLMELPEGWAASRIGNRITVRTPYGGEPEIDRDAIKRDCWRRQWALGTFAERVRLHESSEWNDANNVANMFKVKARVDELQADLDSGIDLLKPEGDYVEYTAAYIDAGVQTEDQAEYLQWAIGKAGVYLIDAMGLFMHRVLFEDVTAAWDTHWLAFLDTYKAQFRALCQAKGKACPLEDIEYVFDRLAVKALDG